MPICPECESALDFDEEEVEEGDVIVCDECGTEYEIVATDPLELSKMEEDYEDEEELRRRGGRVSRMRPFSYGGGSIVGSAAGGRLGCCSAVRAGRDCSRGRAQDFGVRDLKGKMLEGKDAPINGAMVYLENSRNNDIKSFIPEADGATTSRRCQRTRTTRCGRRSKARRARRRR